MLWIIGPYAAVVVASLIGYGLLPRRSATFLMLLGLGPLTLIRPWIAAAAGLAAAWAAHSVPVALCALLASACVLSTEGYVHRRWYAQPT
jgi:hypothetical protein